MSRCLLCGRVNTTDLHNYTIAQHSAAQGSCVTGGVLVKEHVSICASCHYYWDGTQTGMTQSMRASAQMVSGGPFMDLPKDVRFVWLACACSGGPNDSISGWFPKMIKAMSGDTSFWSFRI